MPLVTTTNRQIPKAVFGLRDWTTAVRMMRAELTPGESQFFAAETAENFYERRRQQVEDIYWAFKRRRVHGYQILPWRPVAKSPVKMLYRSFAKLGHVRDSHIKVLDRVTERVLDLICRLDVTNDLSGHSTRSGSDIFDEEGLEPLTKNEWQKMYDFLETPKGEYLVSDYGMPFLITGFGQIFEADSPEEKFLAIDRVFNVVHQRGDLSALFIEGGSATLGEIMHAEYE
jgi:hypothetical protein